MSAKPVSFTILDKEYLINVSDEDRDGLNRAIDLLDKKMREVKSSGKVIGTERIAVMAALHIAHELMEYKLRNENYTTSIDSMVRRLQSKIDEALTRGQHAEIR